MNPRPLETLADGSWLAEFRPSGNAGRHAEPLMIRVIDYSIDDGRGDTGPYRLFTTFLDPPRRRRPSWRSPTRSDGRSSSPSTS